MRSPLRPAAAVMAAAIAIGVPALAAPLAHADDLAPDLVVSSLPAASPEPGEVYDRNVTVTNQGTAPADGVTFRIRLTRGLDFPEHADGCTYYMDDPNAAILVRAMLGQLTARPRPPAAPVPRLRRTGG
ncbi:CARDB domain-containing protein [Streptomyces sp. AGS-58]|uniref:CARDB domain-containing protein n=1 Tax=unclassified Streptomyces TaxID=2593676 RepID=UPI0035A3C860